MTVWTRTLVYLGLREEPDDVDWSRLEGSETGDAAHATPPAGLAEARAGIRVAAPGPSGPSGSSNVRSLRSGLDVSSERVAVVQVHAFDDVETIGSRYRLRNAVLFDMSGCEKDVARRVLDFVSGLTYATRGVLVRVAGRAFLLTPEGVDLPLDERRRLGQLGYEVGGVQR
jgi:cell division inhibitor SepF